MEHCLGSLEGITQVGIYIKINRFLASVGKDEKNWQHHYTNRVDHQNSTWDTLKINTKPVEAVTKISPADVLCDREYEMDGRC